MLIKQIFNDTRAFIGFGLVFVSVLSSFQVGLVIQVIIAFITGMLLLISSINGTRLKLYGRISSTIATALLSFLGYSTNNYFMGLIIFYCAIVICFEVVRS